MSRIDTCLLMLQAAFFAASVTKATTAVQPTGASTALLAHWEFDGDFLDSAGKSHGQPSGDGIRFVSGVHGKAAYFDGNESFIEIADNDQLYLASDDFSISVWVKLEPTVTDVFGDIVTKFDPDRRKGFNFSITGSSPGYDSVGDSRNVHFGIDNAVSSTWEDCGTPEPSCTVVTVMAVYKGDLYAGIANADTPEKACRVFRYAGGKEWIDCGRITGDDPTMLPAASVQSMIVHDGRLYAGTGIWDWVISRRAGEGVPVRIYRYEGGAKWTDCGEFGTGVRTLALASYKGHLYASDDPYKTYNDNKVDPKNKKKVFRYEGGANWVCAGEIDTNRIGTMMVYRGKLYGGGHGAGAEFFRYDGGTTWTRVGKAPPNITQIHTLQVYAGKLYAGTWLPGKVFRYDGDMNWVECGVNDKYDTKELNDLTVYNGKLYAGTIPRAEVYRYEGGSEWSFVKRLVNRRDYPNCRVLCLTAFQGKLYGPGSPSRGRGAPHHDFGRVFCMEAGKNATYDDDLGSTWRHLAAVREGRRLNLYVDGTPSGVSAEFEPVDFDVANDKPLLIGFGARNYFTGAMDDLRIYRGALDARQVKNLCERQEGLLTR